MADKKAIIIMAESADLTGPGAGLDSLRKKAALFSTYTSGELLGNCVVEGSATKVQPADVAENVEKGTPLMVLDMAGADAAALASALEIIIDAMDRKSVLAVVGKGSLALYGSGIDSKAGTVSRTATAQDIIPTLAYIADFPITKECTGAILYQGLKNPNLKADELSKLKEAINRMEGALARDNREPWDKHDCA